mgnify:CR=1 FL=1
MATFNTLVISKIQRETSKAVSISFDVPESLKNTYAFEAGQYLTLKTKIDGIVERNEQLELINQSATQNNQQMLQKVQEFKTRFVDMNNKYHKLKEKVQH